MLKELFLQEIGLNPDLTMNKHKEAENEILVSLGSTLHPRK